MFMKFTNPRNKISVELTAPVKKSIQHTDGDSPIIFTGREENSFLVSLTEADLLVKALRASKEMLALHCVRILNNKDY